MPPPQYGPAHMTEIQQWEALLEYRPTIAGKDAARPNPAKADAHGCRRTVTSTRLIPGPAHIPRLSRTANQRRPIRIAAVAMRNSRRRPPVPAVM